MTDLRVELSRRVKVVVVRSQAPGTVEFNEQSRQITLIEAVTDASFSCRACSGDSIPSVVHTSIPIPRTSRTMCRMRSKPRLRPARSLHAAPMQNRVLPFALAFRAASSTGSTSSRRDAVVGVEYLEDCEQYEPIEIDERQAASRCGGTHSPPNIRRLQETYY